MVKHTVFGEERDLDIPDDIFPSESQINELEKIIPGECQHGWIDSVYEAKKLHYRTWMPKENAKGIIVWFSGIQTHSGNAYKCKDGRPLNMSLLVDQLVLKGGYALVSLDMLGHGYSEGIRFYVPSWETNRDDYITLVKLIAKTHTNNIPHMFLAGISYGGNLALHVAKYFQDAPKEEKPAGLDSIMVLAPAVINPDLPPYPVYALLRYILAPLFPTWTPFFMPNPVNPERCWRDPEARELHLKDPHCQMLLDGGGRAFRLGTAVNLLLALEVVKDTVIPQLNVPFLCIHGNEDYAVPMSGSEHLMKHSATSDSEKELKIIEGGYHDLLSDTLAQETVDAMLSWMSKRIK